MMRKKAMDSMMKEGPSIMVSVKKKPMMEMKDGEEEGKEGFVSMMVSAEEKAMIEKMRKGEMGDGESEESEMESEDEGY